MVEWCVLCQAQGPYHPKASGRVIRWLLRREGMGTGNEMKRVGWDCGCH